MENTSCFRISDGIVHPIPSHYVSIRSSPWLGALGALVPCQVGAGPPEPVRMLESPQPKSPAPCFAREKHIGGGTDGTVLSLKKKRRPPNLGIECESADTGRKKREYVLDNLTNWIISQRCASSPKQ